MFQEPSRQREDRGHVELTDQPNDLGASLNGSPRFWSTMSILFDIDPVTGAVETFDFDHSTGTSVITRTVNVDHVLERNAQSYNEGKGRNASWRGVDNDFWHVGSVPLEELQNWLNEFNAKRAPADKIYSFLTEDEEWERFMYARWNDPDYRKLKTAPVNF